MYSVTSKPKDYVPYVIMNLFSNKIINGAAIVASYGNIVLLIGKGIIPQVWLYDVTKAEDGAIETLPLIENSILSQEMLCSGYLSIKASDGLVEILLNGAELLRVRESEDGCANIEHLDLRLMGIDVFGSDDRLFWNGNSIRNSSFDGGSTIISLNAVNYNRDEAAIYMN